jgi:lysozyme
MPETMPEDAAALAAALVKQWEGLRLKPYLCPAGHATIGWGTSFYPDGRRVTLDDRAIGEAQADEFLAAALAKIWNELKSRLARAPTAHQAAAMISLGYNIGAGALAGSTLLAKFNAGDARGAAAEFSRWCHGRVNGKEIVIEGLLLRREEEAALFLTPDDEP